MFIEQGAGVDSADGAVPVAEVKEVKNGDIEDARCGVGTGEEKLWGFEEDIDEDF